MALRWPADSPLGCLRAAGLSLDTCRTAKGGCCWGALAAWAALAYACLAWPAQAPTGENRCWLVHKALPVQGFLLACQYMAVDWKEEWAKAATVVSCHGVELSVAVLLLR